MARGWLKIYRRVKSVGTDVNGGATSQLLGHQQESSVPSSHWFRSGGRRWVAVWRCKKTCTDLKGSRLKVFCLSTLDFGMPRRLGCRLLKQVKAFRWSLGLVTTRAASFVWKTRSTISGYEQTMCLKFEIPPKPITFSAQIIIWITSYIKTNQSGMLQCWDDPSLSRATMLSLQVQTTGV